MQRVIFHAYLLGLFGIAISPEELLLLIMPSYLQIIVVLCAFGVTHILPFKRFGVGMIFYGFFFVCFF